MNSLKPLAPKPIRRHSNVSGIKLESGFDQFAFGAFTGPNSMTGHKTFAWGKDNISIEKFDINFKLNKFEKDDIDSEFDFDKNFCRDTAKSEIISILNKNDSTFHKTSYFTNSENNLMNFSDETSKNEDEDIIKTTIPPRRISNPFHKNFDEVSDEEELNIIKYHSSNLLKKNFDGDIN